MKKPKKAKKTKKFSKKALRARARAIVAKSRNIDWMDTPAMGEKSAVSMTKRLEAYNPDEEFEKLAKRPVMNPVIQFNQDLKEGKVEVEEAWLFEGRFDERGSLMKEAAHLKANDLVVPFRLVHVTGAEFKARLNVAESLFKELPDKLKRLAEAKAKHLRAVESLKKEGLLEDSFSTDQIQTTYDANQYTEYTPTYGGPFNKQLYIYDYLTMHARAFEAKNHNPIAKRVVDVLAQYAFGRRFKVRIDNKRQLKIWEDFDSKHKIVHKLAEFWSKEYLTYGELMIDKMRWDSIDPSTVWDIITNPDDIGEVYYYYQSYPTAYQTFTGYRVTGEPGAEKQEPLKYIIRQLPAHQVMHIKGNVVSQEKRGRSILFPILGWLKRIKDLYNAEVIRAQLAASFVWDDTVDGNAGDVNAHAAQYSSMPSAASVFVHNKAIERKAMPAIPGDVGRAGGGVSEELLSFIATAVGIPKEFLNVMGQGGSNRATALVGSEPFEKVIEDLQAKFENLLLNIAEELFEMNGVPYNKGDVEFTFPSVTKDTTSEMIKNVGTGEALGYIDHQTASEMFAAELNITTYDYEEIKKRIEKDGTDKADPLMPPSGRFGQPPKDDTQKDEGSPLHGTPKSDLKNTLKTL